VAELTTAREDDVLARRWDVEGRQQWVKDARASDDEEKREVSDRNGKNVLGEGATPSDNFT